jgi:hypothetical protein
MEPDGMPMMRYDRSLAAPLHYCRGSVNARRNNLLYLLDLLLLNRDSDGAALIRRWQ